MRTPGLAHTTTAYLFTQLSGHRVQALLPRTDQSEASTFFLTKSRCFREAGGQAVISHKAWVADTSVAAHGVYAVSIGTNSLNLALINIDTASGIQPLIALRTFNQRNRCFLGAFLAFVESP